MDLHSIPAAFPLHKMPDRAENDQNRQTPLLEKFRDFSTSLKIPHMSFPTLQTKPENKSDLGEIKETGSKAHGKGNTAVY